MLLELPQSVTNREHGLTDRYSLVATDNILTKLADHAWQVASSSERQVRKESLQGKQFHVVKLEHPDYYLGDDKIQLVVTNSHNGKNSVAFHLGIFRMVCSNGLIAGNALVPAIKIPHNQSAPERAIELVLKYMDTKAASLSEAVQVMKHMQLDRVQQELLARQALLIRGFEPAKINNYSINSILEPNRVEDASNSLWNTYNTVQESVERGLYMLDEVGHARPIKSVVKQLDFNSQLFDASLKMIA